jgi:hypothetical protein
MNDTTTHTPIDAAGLLEGWDKTRREQGPQCVIDDKAQAAPALARRVCDLEAALRECADVLGAILDGVSVPGDNDIHTVTRARAALAGAEGEPE